ncbi:hypothetical protein [Sulfuriferula multivorans]|uniref:hypothetical protein n=1 Tax=Sulfuriferula multivorans TaxID=1559896 RepID=UPI000F5BEBF5|nr:hypothetical protein [Sulfuriferula multivorans]
MTPQAPASLSDVSWNWLLALGLLLLPLQMIQIGIVQSSQLWAVLALALLIQRAQIRASVTETLVYAMFIGFALVATFFSGYPHIKLAEQLMKFGFVYPAFFLIGRAMGSHYLKRALPYTYTLLWVGFGLQYLVQFFQIPYLYHPVDFGQDALYGTFKERNWLAIYFFLGSYLLFLQSPRRVRDVLYFVVLGVPVALLSQSKTILIPVGMVMFLHVPRHWGLKTLLGAAGGALYIWLFGNQLTGHLLQVRLQDERGLAFLQSVKLLSDNWLGYGFGFVEAYFSNLWFSIQGLGMGTNSVFSSPLDLMLIAGIPGLIFWGVFFLGIGLRSIALLAPIAAWSLINPLHQSEIVYLFMGILVSWGMQHEAFEHRFEGKELT